MVPLHHCGLGVVLSCMWIGLFDMASCLVVSAIPASVEATVLRSSLTGGLCPCLIAWAPSITHCRGRRMLAALAQRLDLLGEALGRPLRLTDILGGGLGRPLRLVDLLGGGLGRSLRLVDLLDGGLGRTGHS
jgi:hypothetical protein